MTLDIDCPACGTTCATRGDQRHVRYECMACKVVPNPHTSTARATAWVLAERAIDIACLLAVIVGGALAALVGIGIVWGSYHIGLALASVVASATPLSPLAAQLAVLGSGLLAGIAWRSWTRGRAVVAEVSAA